MRRADERAGRRGPCAHCRVLTEGGYEGAGAMVYYGLPTSWAPEVEELINGLRADANVYGARLMGGGFGGNLLALTKVSNVTQLIEQVQAEFYDPRGRDCLNEGAVMVSTPGDGLSVYYD